MCANRRHAGVGEGAFRWCGDTSGTGACSGRTARGSWGFWQLILADRAAVPAVARASPQFVDNLRPLTTLIAIHVHEARLTAVKDRRFHMERARSNYALLNLAGSSARCGPTEG